MCVCVYVGVCICVYTYIYIYATRGKERPGVKYHVFTLKWFSQRYIWQNVNNC